MGGFGSPLCEKKKMHGFAVVHMLQSTFERLHSYHPAKFNKI